MAAIDFLGWFFSNQQLAEPCSLNAQHFKIDNLLQLTTYEADLQSNTPAVVHWIVRSGRPQWPHTVTARGVTVDWAGLFHRLPAFSTFTQQITGSGLPSFKARDVNTDLTVQV